MIISKIKELIKGATYYAGERDIFIIFFFITSVVISFNLGRLAEKEDTARVKIERSTFTEKTLKDFTKDPQEGLLEGREVTSKEKTIWASKNGSKFYYAWCSGASRVKEENRVYYDSKEQAENSGKTLASNCK